MSLLTNFDFGINFWSAYPQLRIPKVFSSLYKEDKSKGKENSSKIMWAIAMAIDNSEQNKFRNLTYEDRKDLISEEYLEDKKFNWDKYQSLIDAYSELNMSKLEKSLLTYEHKLEERDVFIRGVEYELDNLDKIDKAMKSTADIFDLITKLKDSINKEKNNGITKSGMVESGLESGMFV